MGWVKFNITEMGATPGILKRELNGILKQCWEAVGLHWHIKMRPKHFTQAAYAEYGYTPRSPDYEKQKKRAAMTANVRGRKAAGTWNVNTSRARGEALPLVFTGQSREATRFAKIQATSKGVKIVMNAPRLNWRNPKSKINPRDELTRISNVELGTLIDVWQAKWQALVARLQGLRRKAA